MAKTKWVERALAVVAGVCFAWVAAAAVRGVAFAREARRSLSDPPIIATPASVPVPRMGDPIGILEIPRLGVSEIVAEGDTDEILAVAIGHLPDTPLPWEPGRSAVAGHRDGHFRPLKDIRPGDRIYLKARHVSLEYEVERTLIVMPDDLSVITPTPDSYLTLITCYPFSYVGRAPQRFVIHARAVERHHASGASVQR
jgi:sortase A